LSFFLRAASKKIPRDVLSRERKKNRREKREKRILDKLHFFSKRTVKTKKKIKTNKAKGGTTKT